jgi:hypothetical protein
LVRHVPPGEPEPATLYTGPQGQSHGHHPENDSVIRDSRGSRRVLKEKVVERIGDNRPIRVEVRIIPASSRNLAQLIEGAPSARTSSAASTSSRPGWIITGRIQKNTLRSCESVIAPFCREHGNLELEELTVDLVQAFLESITNGRKPQTRKIRFAHITSFFNFVHHPAVPWKDHRHRGHEMD